MHNFTIICISLNFEIALFSLCFVLEIVIELMNQMEVM